MFKQDIPACINNAKMVLDNLFAENIGKRNPPENMEARYQIEDAISRMKRGTGTLHKS
jgi:hypothetical protein